MAEQQTVRREGSTRRNVQLRFPPEISVEPVVCNLVRLFDLDFNILRARITPGREGELTLQLRGLVEACEHGVEYLKGRGIEVSPIDQRIWRDEGRCMDCGMCTALCPTGALSMDCTTRRLVFARETCSACGVCVRICPVRAMQLDVGAAEIELA